MKTFLRVCFVVVSLLLLIASTVAQSRPRRVTQEPDNSIIRIETDLVVFDANVINSSTGKPVTGLQPQDFQLFEDGVKQEIQHLSFDSLPVSVILLLDVSGSMESLIEAMQQGALKCLQKLKPSDKVAVVAYAGNALVIQEFTTDREQIVEAIINANELYRNRIASIPYEQQNFASGTDLNEGLYQSALYLLNAAEPMTRRVIVTFTDDYSYGQSLKSKAAVLDKLIQSKATVYGIIVQSHQDQMAKRIDTASTVAMIALNPIAGLSMWATRHTLNKTFGMNQRHVKDYASRTEGKVFTITSGKAVETLSKLIDELRVRYSFGFSSTNANFDGSYRKLKLKSAPGLEKRIRSSIRIEARKGYYALRKRSS